MQTIESVEDVGSVSDVINREDGSNGRDLSPLLCSAGGRWLTLVLTRVSGCKAAAVSFFLNGFSVWAYGSNWFCIELPVCWVFCFFYVRLGPVGS